MREDGIYGTEHEHEHEPLPLALNEASRLLVFCRRCRGRDGLAKKLSRAVIGGIADLMSGGIVTEDNSADHALVLGEMDFFDHVITGVIFILGKETKLLFRAQDFGAGKSAVFIELVANLFPHLPVLARCGGDGLMIGSIVFVNRARAIGVKDDADANIAAVLLGEGTKWCGGESKGEGGGDAAHGSKRSGGGN